MTRPAYRYRCTVLRVIDGDTLELDVDLGFHAHYHATVRLLGWNCPELSEPNGHKARIAAHTLTHATTDLIVETEKDAQTFARWLGRIYVDGIDLGELLQARGLATKRL